MKVSIISTIFATIFAASSAAPFNTHCQSQINALRQIQIDTLLQLEVTATFYGAAGASFTLRIPADGQTYPIRKFILVFFLFFLFYYTSVEK
jgi:hypothetical protein